MNLVVGLLVVGLLVNLWFSKNEVPRILRGYPFKHFINVMSIENCVRCYIISQLVEFTNY